MKALWKYGLMLGVVLALATSLGWTKANDNSAANKTATVNISVVTTMPDGALLQPGTYKMTFFADQKAPEVAFYKNGKLICKCPVKIESMPKPDYTRLEYTTGENDTHTLTGLAIGGWEQKLVFGKGDAENAGS
ncbi:MAG TPA: hypothetical protein VL523_19705 [Terriglobia bacterium]|nr:hypothetical protein [Terriglobia bacterium]